MKRMGKQRGIQLHKDNTFSEKKFPADQQIVKPTKDEECIFAPLNVFAERKTWSKFKFWRTKRHLIFFVEGIPKALGWNELREGMNPFWTMKEARDFVHKYASKTLVEQKAIKTWQFIVILMILFFILVLEIRKNMAIGP